jgi:Protein of unknown function (DUF1822)
MTDLPLTELALAISLDLQEQSWQSSQIATGSPAGRWQLYLNQLCLEALLPWLQAELEPEAQVWPSRSAAATLWRVVNGTAITLGAKRLVLIPDKCLETDALRVPQEWIDVPSWSGDYYVAVQMNAEGDGLRVWGYATHAQIKQGDYDPTDRAYHLPALQMVCDLNALAVVRQLNPQEQTQAVIAPVAALNNAELSACCAQLAQPTPRLELPLGTWNAFLERPDRASQLDQIFAAPAPPPGLIATPATSLGQWFDGLFGDTWQAIESLMDTQPNLALSFRKLVADDAQINGSLATKVRRVKLLPIESNGLEQRVLLMLSLEREVDGRVGVRVQLLPAEGLRPTSGQRALPADLQLSLLSVSGAVVQSVAVQSPDLSPAQSPPKSQNGYIRLKLFRCAPGTRFAIQVATPGFSVIEPFVS